VARLFLSGNPLGRHAGTALATLAAAGVLTELYVSAAGLGDTGARALAEGLYAAGPRAALRRLSVASNGIGPAAAATLVEVAAATGVELLDLGRVPAAGPLGAADNHLGAQGAAAVGAVLVAWPHRLAHLDLRACGVGDAGAQALLDAARRAPSPTRYVLGAGVARGLRRELNRLTAGVPDAVPHPDVAAIRSVHR
jgi:Ran GTPase-activating protein (RanGAP) involved in mRNA processing and transport